MIPYSRIELTRLTNQDCFKIKTEKQIIIVDPGFLGNFDDQHFNSDQLEKASLILISHHHFDHLNPQLLELLTNKKTVILASEKCQTYTSLPLTIVKPGDLLTHEDIQIKVVDAYNTPLGRSNPKNHLKGECLGYVFRINGKNFYFAGDTDVIEEMKDLGQIDVAMLPIGGTYVMDAQEALEAALLIKPQLILAMHQMSCDPLVFKALVNAVNIRLVFLKPGEQLTL